MKSKKAFLLLILSGIFLNFSAYAGDKTKSTTIDCSKDSLGAEIAKLDPSISNVLEFTGNCNGLITINGYQDLTLIGDAIDGGSISGEYVEGDFESSVTALDIVDSKVTLQNVTINSGRYGLFCTERSTCTLRDVIVQGGFYGVAAQGQSALDILGATQIVDSQVWGVSAFGASRVNMRPNWDAGFDSTEPGPLVSGHDVGVWVMDGSFFRSDNVAFTENVTGIVAQRDVMIKVFSNDSGLGVTGSIGDGIIVRQNSSAQVLAPVTGNGGSGIQVGSLSYLQAIGEIVNGNGGEDFACVDVTASSPFCPSLTQTISDLQTQVAALTEAANATLEQKVAGKIYAYRTTGHGIGGTARPAPDLPIVLENPSRDFSVGEGALSLNGDGTWSVQLALTAYPTTLLYDGISVLGFLDRYEPPELITNGGTWSTDEVTGEILLDDGVGVQRLQASPNGEVLTVVANDIRAAEGDPTSPGFYLTFIADALYVQLPDSE